MSDHIQKPYTFDRVVRMVLSLAFVIGFYFLLQRLSSVLVPFLIAVLMAYLINPLVNFLQLKAKFKYRGLSVFAALVIVLGTIYSLIIWLVPQFITEMTRMIVLIRQYLLVAELKSMLPKEIIEWIKDYVSNTDFVKMLNPQNVTETIKKLFVHGWSVFSGSLNIAFSMLSALIILVYMVFLLIDFSRISKGWINLVPPTYRDTVQHVFVDLSTGMNIYFRAQGLIALIVGVLLAIGFKIIGLPLAIMMGLFIGALNIVPYLQIVGFIPVTLLALLKAMETNQSFWHVLLAAAAVMAIVQVIQETVLVPKIMGRVYGLHPAIILLSLSIWGSLLGLLGMLVALPLTTLLFSYYNRIVLQNKSTKEPSEAQ